MEAWDNFLAGWDAVQADWSANWRSAFQDAQRWWDGSVDQDAIEAWFAWMEGADSDIKALQNATAGLPTAQAKPYQGRASAYRQAWNDLGAGVYPYVQEVSPGIGVAPLVVVGGLAVGAAGVAWIMYSLDKAETLAVQVHTDRLRAETEAQEFAARYALHKEGKVLQESTLKTQANPTSPEDEDKAGSLFGLAAGLGVVGLVLAAAFRLVGGSR